MVYCSLFIPLGSCAQTKTLPKSINGEYVFKDTVLLVGTLLNLKNDGSYLYRTGGDIETNHSYGRWTLNGDTLLLTSSINRNNIPVIVNKKNVDTIKENIVMRQVPNLDNEIMDAAFMFNGDTSNLCIPFWETGCNQKIGSVDSFRIGFGNKTYTSWIKLKDKRTNLIEVTAQVHDVLALYLFFDKEKFLYKDGNLQYIIKDKNIPSEGVILKKQVINLLRLIKVTRRMKNNDSPLAHVITKKTLLAHAPSCGPYRLA